MSPVPFQAWITTWAWVLAIGLGFYFLVVAVTIPLGAIDIRRLFERLEAERKARELQSEIANREQGLKGNPPAGEGVGGPGEAI